nr:hypothetical protein RKHAN_00236 [Rhizobium sp. Khangiran2]
MVSYAPYDRETLDLSFQWFQDAELRSLTSTPVVDRQSQESWFASLPSRKNYKIWSLRNGRRAPIGAFGLKNIVDEEAEYWGFIGDAQNWGKGFGIEMMKFAEEEASALGIKRLYLNVIFSNYRAINLYFRQGYKIMGVTLQGYRMEKVLHAV